jgi:hypothetical protein
MLLHRIIEIWLEKSFSESVVMCCLLLLHACFAIALIVGVNFDWSSK